VSDEDDLFGEIAWLAGRFGWSFDELLDLEHPLRRRFVAEIERLDGRAARGV